jgi:hypothetical protein
MLVTISPESFVFLSAANKRKKPLQILFFFDDFGMLYQLQTTPPYKSDRPLV